MRNLIWLALPGQLALRCPVLGALILLAVVIGSVISILFLRFDADIDRNLSSKNPYLDGYRTFLERLGEKPRQIQVYLRAPDAFGPIDFRAVQEISLEIGLLDHVTAVASIGTAQFPDGDDSFGGEPVIPFDGDDDELVKRLDAFEQLPTIPDLLLSDDSTTALVLVMIDAAAPSQAPVDIAREIKAFAADGLAGRLEIGVSGQDLLGAEIVDALKSDLVFFSLGGGFLALCVAIYLFRNVRLILLCVVPAILASLTSIGLYPILGMPVTVINNVIPILVFVLALADSVHLVLAYIHHEHRNDDEVCLGAAGAIDRAGPGCALAALTTAIAFAAIGINDDPQLRGLALLGMSGVLAGYLVVVIGFPVLVQALRPRGPATVGPHSSSFAPVARAIIRHRNAVLIAGLLVALVAAVSASRVEPWFAVEKKLPDASEVRRASEVLAKTFGGFHRFWAEFDTSGEASLDTAAGRARLQEKVDRLQKAADDYPVISALALYRWAGAGPDGRLDSDAAAELPMLNLLLTQDDNLARVLILMPEPMRDTRTLERYDRIQRTAEELGAVLITGLPVVLRHEPWTLISQMATALVVAALVSCILVAAAFGRLWLLAALILPNTLPILVAAGVYARWSGGHFEPVAMLSLTIAFGIAINDSIHVISRYADARRCGEEFHAAIQTAITRAGRSVIATTALICAGLCLPLWSSFDSVRIFAFMQIVSLVAAMFTSLILLPASILQRDKH